MARSQWHESYRTHIRQIDAQHIALFERVAELSAAIERGDGERELRRVLFSLLEYTRTHFADEEALLERVGYPDLSKHISEHAAFVGRLRKWLDEPSLVEPVAVLKALEQWLSVHIARSDAAYVPCVLCYKDKAMMR